MIAQCRKVSALGYLLGMDEQGKVASDATEKIIGAPDFVLVVVLVVVLEKARTSLARLIAQRLEGSRFGAYQTNP